MNTTDRKKILRNLVILAVTVFLCVLFAGVNSRYLKENPFNREFILNYPSAGTVDAKGNIYVIDQSKQRVSSFTPDGYYRYQILGGSRSPQSFYAAEDMKADPAGNLYIVDIVLSLEDYAIERERIIKFDSEGRFSSVLYEMIYEVEDRPLTMGRIQGLTLFDDGLEFVFHEKDQISLKKLTFSDSGVTTAKTIAYDTNHIISYGVDKNSGSIYGVTKMADILELYDDGTDAAIYKGEEHDADGFFSIPWKVAVDDRGYLYFTDIGLRHISFIASTGEPGVAINRADQENLGNNRIFYSLDVSSDGKLTAIASSEVYVKQIDEEGLMRYRTFSYSGNYLAFRALVFLITGLAVILILLQLHRVLKLKIRITFTEMAKNNLIIIVVAVIIAVVSVSGIMDGMQKQYRAQVMNNMCSVADLIGHSLRGEDIEQLNTPQDYNSKAYQRIREEIQHSFSTNNGWSEGLYCVLNRVKENKIIYSCFYLEDTIGTVYPLDYDYYDAPDYQAMYQTGYGSEYEELYETGRQIQFDWIENTDGIWSYVLSPVFNDQGEVVAAMEVGTNLYAFQEANNAMIKNMLFQIVSIIAIIILMFTELSFLWFYREKQKNAEQTSRELPVYIIRPMIFVIFMADCMATAFLPMLAGQLAVPLWGIPAEMMSAVPISIEVLLTAVFSFAGGFFIEKYGFRKILLCGSILFTAGLTAVGFSGSMIPFILAKAVIGIGMGLLLVGINTLLASYPEQDSRSGFSFYHSGSLAGLTVGTTIGSFLAATLGYFNVYFVAAGISLIFFVMIMVLLKQDTIYPVVQVKQEEESTISIVRFLFKKELVVFFACAMIPYMICGYFLNYFMPLFAESRGMTETAIGQLFLINGICVIYLGPSLTAVLTGKLKSKYPVIIAGAVYIVTLLLFFLFTGEGMVVGTALLFGIADSFGFSALSIYFSGLDVVKSYGSGKAIGIYSTFDNISQTVGPFVFGMVFVMGVKKGVLMIAVVYLALLTLYTLLGKKNPTTA